MFWLRNKKIIFLLRTENDQQILHSQTADKPMAPQERATQQSPDTRKTN